MFVSVTRLKVRRVWLLPAFFWLTFRVARVSARAPGYLQGRLRTDKGWVFYTVTAWSDVRAMGKFLAGSAHQRASAWFAAHCSEGVVTNFQHAGEVLPSWDEVHAHLRDNGRFPAVDEPTLDHSAKRVPPLRASFIPDRPLPGRRR